VFGPVTSGCDCAGPQRGSGLAPTRRFLSAPPKSPCRSRPTVLGCGLLSEACPFKLWAAGCWAGERASAQLVGPVMDARPWHPRRPSRDVRHRARGCAGTLQVGGFSGCGHLQLCHLGIPCDTRSDRPDLTGGCAAGRSACGHPLRVNLGLGNRLADLRVDRRFGTTRRGASRPSRRAAATSRQRRPGRRRSAAHLAALPPFRIPPARTPAGLSG